MKLNFCRFFIFSIILLFLAGANSYQTQPSDIKNISINTVISSQQKTEENRILIIAPHPDDETLGCARVISMNVNEGNKVEIVLMTNGDLYYKPKDDKVFDFDHDGDIDNIDYGYIRQQETVTAMEKLGVNKKDIIFLCYPDASLMDIYNRNYNDLYVGINNGFSLALALQVRGSNKSPFKNSYHLKTFKKEAVFTRECIIKDLENILSDFRPTDIYITHEFDFHDDHKATPLFIREAIKRLKEKKVFDVKNIRTHRYLIHYDLPNKARMMDEYPDPKNPRLGVRDFVDNCKQVPWEMTILGSPPNGSISLDENFKRIKHELINCYQTQVFDDYFPKKCSGETEYSWLHQFVKDREEWWDWPIDYFIPFDYYDKWSFASKIKHYLKVFLTIIRLKAKIFLGK